MENLTILNRWRSKKRVQKIKIYTDAEISCIAYINVATGEEKIIANPHKLVPPWNYSVINEQITLNEFNAIYEALKSVDKNTVIEIISDCKSAIEILRKEHKTHNIRIRHKKQSIHRLIKRENLKVQFTWVPREENLAGQLLEKRMRG